MTLETALEAINSGDYVQDIGQLDKKVRRKLDYLAKRGKLKKAILFWPWITCGTCTKMTYWKEG